MDSFRFNTQSPHLVFPLLLRTERACLACRQRKSDGSFERRTLHNVCFSPIVMPPKDADKESSLVRQVPESCRTTTRRCGRAVVGVVAVTVTGGRFTSSTAAARSDFFSKLMARPHCLVTRCERRSTRASWVRTAAKVAQRIRKGCGPARVRYSSSITATLFPKESPGLLRVETHLCPYSIREGGIVSQHGVARVRSRLPTLGVFPYQCNGPTLLSPWDSDCALFSSVYPS